MECISNTGVYIFNLGEADEISSEKNLMLLEYQPEQLTIDSSCSPSPHHNVDAPLQVHAKFQMKKARIERWNSEQIRDFVRKLGFLDKDEEGGDNIKHFLQLNQVTKLIPSMDLCALSFL